MKPLRLAALVLLGFILAENVAGSQTRGISPRGIERLEREIRSALVTLPFYSVFDNLQYRVDGDKVVLMGQVTTPTLKSGAESAVQEIEGVASIDNQIEVLPLSNMDDEIRRAVYFKLFSQDSPLLRYGMGAVPPIHIVVKGGSVTLEGVVASEADKITAGMLTKQLSGIVSVTNNLRVEGS
jgi:hyperosmotically inducible protein